MATKVKSAWYCNECGHREHKWTGQCPSCDQWNSFAEEIEAPATARFEAQQKKPSRPVRLNEITLSNTPRHMTQIGEFDRLVGGGLVHGSLSLIAGDPGIGKSTLLLQVANALGRMGKKVLYICGEESIEQTYSRAQRLNVDSENLFFLSETQYSIIRNQVEAISPDILIVDSIQIVYKAELSSSPGSVSQVRETATEFMHLAKGHNITTLLVGHVTKSGEIAGPRVLEHLVDTVLYFEGDRHQNYRTMRAVKNRFGATDEIAVFQMESHGLVEVTNPSQIFIEERVKDGIGSVIIPTLDGTRPILVEVQALVTPTAYPTPSRKCAGLDQNRLSLLLAVLEKRLKFRLHGHDVFVSVAGGVRIMEPSLDLGILLAVTSSLKNVPIHHETVVCGEVGLGGEIRSVAKIDARIKEARRMGFSRCVIPKRNMKGITESVGNTIDVIGVDRVEEAIGALVVR